MRQVTIDTITAELARYVAVCVRRYQQGEIEHLGQVPPATLERVITTLDAELNIDWNEIAAQVMVELRDE